MTKEAVLQAFLVLERAGVRAPYADAQQAEESVATWLLTLGDVPDAALGEAVVEHLRGPKAAFWPRPGELLRLAPRREGRVLHLVQHWRFSELPADVRMRLLAQAVDEVEACGTKCDAWPHDCRCAVARLERIDQLAAEAQLAAAGP